MHLSDRQLDRFFDLLDGLLVFANERLDLVDSLRLPIEGRQAEMKAAYVCDALWGHPEVIEEFVRLNPRKLKPADLEQVAAWTDALRDRFTLVRFERGRAILMNDAGLFAVAGMDDEPQRAFDACPDMLAATLLPFEGLIVTDGLVSGDGIPFNEEEAAQMEERLARLEPAGVAWTAAEFAERARAFNRQARERDFDDLMKSLELEARQSRDGERLPEGFHRGVLAGLPPEERARRVKGHDDELAARSAPFFDRALRAQVIDEAPSDSLADCLAAGMARDELVKLCGMLEVPCDPTAGRREIAQLLVEPLARQQEALRLDLLAFSQESFDLFARIVAAGGRVSDPASSFGAFEPVESLTPYVFRFWDEGSVVSLIPRELLPMARAVDLEAAAYDRLREDALVNCADAMAVCYGLLSLREAYDLYRGAVVDAYPLEDFVALLMGEDAYDDQDFVLQDWHDDSYLMHYSISESHLDEEVLERHHDEFVRDAPAILQAGGDSPLLEKLYRQVSAEAEAERAELEAYRKRIVADRANVPRRPLSAAAAEGDIFDAFRRLPAVVQLRDFYDAHVPDGADDYSYADRAVEDLLLHAASAGNVDAYLDSLEQMGVNRCAEDDRLLLRLAENAYGALPSWGFYGWSPQEMLENMSGRKVFYNARGEMLRPAPDDPCPCGSGKPYSECHGK